MPRRVTLVLVSRSGAVAGVLPPFHVETPWWMQVGEVVESARALHGVDVTILRLLHGEGDEVVYLAEADGLPDDEPLRAAYARPGGPAEALAWADNALVAAGRQRVGRPEQQRTWNLSAIWRIPLEEGAAWLKVVPPFFAHEGAVMALLQDTGLVPPLLAADGGRILLADVPGEDQYGRPTVAMVEAIVRLQMDWVGRTDALLATGANDWRAVAFIPAAEDVVDRGAGGLATDQRAALDGLVAGLADRFADLAGCGLPETLVHGDFHAGNVRSDGERLVILDWGDSGVGHPLFDLPAFLDRVPEPDRPGLTGPWLRPWSDAVPGSDPERAAQLIAPIAALRQAVVYRMFLDHIEAAEHPYHAADVPDWLARAAALA